MAQQYATNVGDGASVAITVTHNLATLDVEVELYDNTTPFARVLCEVERPNVSQVTLRFDVAPSASQYRVVVIA